MSAACNMTVIRNVYSTNDSATLGGAVGYALYRLPQQILITGYTYVAEYDPLTTSIISNVFNLDVGTGVVGADTGYAC